VAGVQLDNIGPLAAWSYGYYGDLVCTDVTTAQTLTSEKIPAGIVYQCLMLDKCCSIFTVALQGGIAALSSSA
jgi:hypothetical protein